MNIKLLLTNLIAESKHLHSKIPPKKPLMDTDIQEKQAGWARVCWGEGQAEPRVQKRRPQQASCAGRGGGGGVSLAAVLRPGPSEKAKRELLS